MTEIVKIDKKGRIVIPKSLFTKAEMKEGSYVKLTANERSIVVEPMEPIAEKYFGVFRMERWPADLGEFVVEVLRKWWKPKST